MTQTMKELKEKQWEEREALSERYEPQLADLRQKFYDLRQELSSERAKLRVAHVAERKLIDAEGPDDALVRMCKGCKQEMAPSKLPWAKAMQRSGEGVIGISVRRNLTSLRIRMYCCLRCSLKVHGHSRTCALRVELEPYLDAHD